MNRMIEFGVGLLFGWGLLLSGMTDPGKVQGFLDLAGAWDPSLAFVMGGAVLVGCLAFALAARRTRSVLGQPFQLPATREIDRPLLLGSLIFGVGWGLAGFCPGPALVAMAAGHGKALVFVAAMLVGMAGFDWLGRLSGRALTADPAS
ncbi:YeeE/YedE family protein [Ramlibacter sp.]|uniref:YeeE/YedE family protein n=1 Tax=Ramlibacter sp. TaxID=1917967 RepID=UPI002FCBAAEA